MQRFILGSLRAPLEAVESEVEALEARLILDPDDSLSVGNVILLPVQIDLGPEDVQDRHSTLLNGGLFEDYVVGTICGRAFAASDTDRIQRLRDEKHAYGTGATIVLEALDSSGDWFLVTPAGEEESVLADADPDAEEDDPKPDERRVWYISGDRIRERPIGAEFATEGLRAWIHKTWRPFGPPPVGAKLIFLVTRDEYSKFDASWHGQSLMGKLGDTARTLLKLERAAVIVAKTDLPPSKVYERIYRELPPRQIEDFIIFDIGSEVASRRPEVSALAAWIDRFIVRGEGAEPDDVFDLPRRRGGGHHGNPRRGPRSAA